MFSQYATDVQWLCKNNQYHNNIQNTIQLKMGATSGTGTAYSSGAPELTPVFSGLGVIRSLVLCMFCRSLFFRLSFFFWPLCCLSFFNQGLGGSMGQVVGLPSNSYKPITNAAWVRARLCKLRKGSTQLTVASDKAYQLLAHGRWSSPGTPASSTTKTGRHDIAEIFAESGVKHNKSNQINLLQFTDSDCPFGIFKLFLEITMLLMY